jgi:hypothetical protein
VSEELRFEQRARNGRTVDGHEGTGRAQTGLRQRPGHQLLAGPALPDNHRRSIGRPDARDELAERPQRLRPAKQRAITLGALELAPQPQELSAGVLPLDGAFQNGAQPPQVHRLLQEIEGAGLHDLDGFGHPGAAAHNDKRGVVALGKSFGQEVLAVVPGHVEIRDHHLGKMPPQQGQSGGAVGSLENAEPPALQGLRQRPSTGGIVVDEQHLSGGTCFGRPHADSWAGAASGSQSSKLAPDSPGRGR